jgi:pyruvate,water dikinase
MTAPGRKTVSARQGLDFLALARAAAKDPRCRAYFDSRSRNAGDGHAPFSDYAASLAASPFMESFRNFLARYGHRGVYETDLARPRFREDPSYLLESLAAAARREDLPDLLELERNRLREAREAWLAFTARLGVLDRLFPWRAVAVRWVLRQIKMCQNLREGVRSEGMRVIGAMRRLSLLLGHRWFEGGWLGRPEDIFYLDRAEIDRAAREPMARKVLRALVAARQEAERRWRAVEMPNLICEGQDGRWAPIIPAAPTAAAWRGLAVSGGRVRGPAAVVRTPDDVSKMRPGAVLVAPTTDPAWSALFALAAGVAVEMGGLLSHGSILAREYGIPAVVNVPGLCDAVRDGDLLEVDGWQGTVRRIGDGAESGTAGTP